MVKKAVNPWLRTLVRAGKKQQRTVARTLTALLVPKPAPKPRPAARPRPKPKAAPASGKWLASTFAGLPGSGRMRYWLYLPDLARAPFPLVVMLHGCDQSATLFAEGTRMNHVAQQRGVAVLYPQQSVSAHPHRCWKWYDRAT
jgi:poly(3-hydroxybutyrate) depolymerase